MSILCYYSSEITSLAHAAVSQFILLSVHFEQNWTTSVNDLSLCRFFLLHPVSSALWDAKINILSLNGTAEMKFKWRLALGLLIWIEFSINMSLYPKLVFVWQTIECIKQLIPINWNE